MRALRISQHQRSRLEAVAAQDTTRVSISQRDTLYPVIHVDGEYCMCPFVQSSEPDQKLLAIAATRAKEYLACTRFTHERIAGKWRWYFDLPGDCMCSADVITPAQVALTRLGERYGDCPRYFS